MLGLWGNTRIFRVLVKGKNVLLREAETRRVDRLGFYTARVVKAANGVEAGEMAKALVAEALAKIELLNAPSDGPSLEVDEIEEVDTLEEVIGFTFFLEKEN
jgi:hypothetical protein